MKKANYFFAGVLILFQLSGCAALHISPYSKTKVDRITYVYRQPLDLVYLRTFETLDQHQDWVMQITNKEKGIIEARNINYGNLFDVDKQYVRFLIKRVSRNETSVEIDPDHSRCLGDSCKNLMDHINAVLSQLPPRPKPQKAPPVS